MKTLEWTLLLFYIVVVTTISSLLSIGFLTLLSVPYTIFVVLLTSFVTFAVTYEISKIVIATSIEAIKLGNELNGGQNKDNKEEADRWDDDDSDPFKGSGV